MRSFYKDKRVFITGHTGFKGSWLSLWLTEMGAQVTGYALESPTDPSLFSLCRIDKLVDSIIGDVRDKASLQQAMNEAKPDIVFHLAAQSLVRESYRHPAETFETNCMGNVNLLEAVRCCPTVRAVVIITTDKCYKNKESFWGYKEDDELGGYDPYSASKACAEIITEAYINSFFNPSDYGAHRVAVATARAGNVIGGGDFSRDRLVPDGIHGLLKNEPITLRNPHAVRPWQHVLEPLSGYLELARKLYSEGVFYNGPWNFGPDNENETSVECLMELLCTYWGDEARVVVSDEKHPHETNFLKLDSYKAKRLLSYTSLWSIQDALSKTVQWSRVFQSEGDLLTESRRQIAEYEKDMKNRRRKSPCPAF